MSFIEPQNVVAPKIDVAHYQEGDLTKATYQKQTYDAVISEIHHANMELPNNLISTKPAAAASESNTCLI
ncbi:hypothetical protein DPMN_122747 [Dreissena polymorpha]|uniref:Uncharacterized protein n=1 Tax=Dreissena polymorpha TaxID=45954 RepID=A0A9D4GT38_DREPO|nr:hypothetical protein DPMN_122747 [Dreissena polymorpha]